MGHPPGVARDVVRDIGYDRAKFGFDCDTCAVITSIDEQSPDIALGVDKCLEVKEGVQDDGLDNGAGDQGMMFGYACDETQEYMPLPISLAQKLARRLTQIRKEGLVDYLRPDGKTQVTVEYDQEDRPLRIDAVVVSTQHGPEVELDQIRRDIIDLVIRPTIPASLMDNDTKIYVKPHRPLRGGGPQGDSGLTGPEDHRGHLRRQRPPRRRRLLRQGSHQGGPLRGLCRRWVAKNVVAAGLAKRCQVQLAYAIGVAKPVSVRVDTFGTGTVSDEHLSDMVESVFDLRPAAIIRDLDLRRPIYRQLAAYGHFGRDDLDLPWERTDKAEALLAAR